MRGAYFAGGTTETPRRAGLVYARCMKGGHSTWKALGGAIKVHAVGTQESDI
jgi:hypothetical protein